MTWKSSVLVRLGSEQRKTSAPLSLRASRSASKISGGTSFLDMNTLEPLKAIVFIAGVYLRNPSDVGFWVGKRNQVTRGFGKDGIAFVLCEGDSEFRGAIVLAALAAKKHAGTNLYLFI